MKNILVLLTLTTSLAWGQRTIEAGEMTIFVNGKVIYSGLCDTFDEELFSGISFYTEKKLITTTVEFAKEGAKQKSNNPVILERVIYNYPAQGLCAFQHTLSKVTIEYRELCEDQVKIIQKLRCNRKEYIKEFRCRRP